MSIKFLRREKTAMSAIQKSCTIKKYRLSFSNVATLTLTINIPPNPIPQINTVEMSISSLSQMKAYGYSRVQVISLQRELEVKNVTSATSNKKY